MKAHMRFLRRPPFFPFSLSGFSFEGLIACFAFGAEQRHECSSSSGCRSNQCRGRGSSSSGGRTPRDGDGAQDEDHAAVLQAAEAAGARGRGPRVPGAAGGHGQVLCDEGAAEEGDGGAQEGEARADGARDPVVVEPPVHCDAALVVPERELPVLCDGLLCRRRVLPRAAAPAGALPARVVGQVLQLRGPARARVPPHARLHLPRPQAREHPHDVDGAHRPHRL